MKIERTLNTPEVVLDSKKASLYITGCSYHESANKFYVPVAATTQEFIEKLPKKYSFSVYITLEYLNTSSVVEINKLLNILNRSNKNVYIVWGYESDDESMIEEGKIFQEIHKKLNFSFQLVEDTAKASYL